MTHVVRSRATAARNSRGAHSLQRTVRGHWWDSWRLDGTPEWVRFVIPGDSRRALHGADRAGRVDVAQALLRCTVSNAPTPDISFTLHYTLVDDARRTQPAFDALCTGALAQGAECWLRTYSVVAPRSPTDSSVRVSRCQATALGPAVPSATYQVTLSQQHKVTQQWGGTH
jgi:hypothetical protein